MLIVRRMAHGVRAHFQVRVTEWAMVYPTLGMSLALMVQPDMFETSPSFAELGRWASEGAASCIAMLCALVRFAALVVNGTFRSFPYSPHLRATASLIGAAFWWQVALGFALAAIEGQGAWSAVVAYSTLLILEAVNISRSFADISRGRR
ncbi:hypothetical protein ATO13_08466 [Stappia sp. 22II-S9-Z10]|nr:hypothetical protein ATO13_08466 [Stappia sp. 22II-S9-Z10]